MPKRIPFDDFDEEEDIDESDWNAIKEEFPDFEGLDDLDWLEDHLDKEDDWYE